MIYRVVPLSLTLHNS